MKTIVVDRYSPDDVPVKGKVRVRLPLGLKDYPPNIEPARGDHYAYCHRYMEFDAESPSFRELEEAARFLRNKYNKGSTHTFFETIEVYKVNRRTVLELGFGS